MICLYTHRFSGLFDCCCVNVICVILWVSESSREMPRVRLRSVENLAGTNSALLRFYHWMNGGESWSHHHASVFVITFFRYCSFYFFVSFFSFAFIHASRKTLSTVKPSMIEIWTHNSSHSGPLFPNEQSASEFLALLDGAFLFAYAFVSPFHSTFPEFL